MSNIPETLYHGSLFKQEELMPGFKRSGKLVRWDNTESNLFLYATTDKDTAIELGFASAIEKLYGVTNFHSQGGTLRIESDETLTLDILSRVNVYLYSIPPKEEDAWLKNNNGSNGIKTEYKTNNTIRDIDSCERVDIREWLKKFKVLQRKKNSPREVALESFNCYSW